jgi:hypothetical protein
MSRNEPNTLPILPLALCLALVGCASGGFHDEISEQTTEVPGDLRIEVSLDEDGNVASVEYHVKPEQIPAEARQAILDAIGGGTPVDAEIEYQGGEKQFEMTVVVSGLEKEVLVGQDLKVISKEIELPASETPQELKDAFAALEFLQGAVVSKWEGIYDGHDELLEYHVKATKLAKNYKVTFTTDFEPLVIYREAKAELEIPVRTF